MIGFHQRGRGEPLLLLTGMVVSRADWPEPWLQALEQSFRLVLMDNRGTGESRPAPAPFSMSDLASDAAEVLDQCGVEAAHVFGNSMGGQIALTLAAERPDRVRRLIVCSTKAGDGPLLSPAPELLAKLAALSQYPNGRSELPRLLGGPGFADRQEDVGSSAPIGEQPPQEFDPAVVGSHIRAMATFDPSCFGLVRAPTLVLQGSADPLVPVENARRLVEMIPGARPAILDGVGHLMIQEAPEQVTRLVTEFLAEAS